MWKKKNLTDFCVVSVVFCPKYSVLVCKVGENSKMKGKRIQENRRATDDQKESKGKVVKIIRSQFFEKV